MKDITRDRSSATPIRLAAYMTECLRIAVKQLGTKRCRRNVYNTNRGGARITAHMYAQGPSQHHRTGQQTWRLFTLALPWLALRPRCPLCKMTRKAVNSHQP